MKKYLVISNVVLLGIIAFLVCRDYIVAPVAESARNDSGETSLENDLATVDALFNQNKNVKYEEADDIPSYEVSDESHYSNVYQVAVRYGNMMPKFALLWYRYSRPDGWKTRGDILFLDSTGNAVSKGFRHTEGIKWWCLRTTSVDSTVFRIGAKDPRVCLNVRQAE